MKKAIWLIAGLLTFGLTSCERNDLLLSEKKLEEKIQRTWKVLYSNNSDSRETWTFSQGGVTITWPKNATEDTTVTGTYTIDARFAKAYVKIGELDFTRMTNSGFNSIDLNRAWTIVELNNGILYLSATDNRGAIRSIEFLEQ